MSQRQRFKATLGNFAPLSRDASDYYCENIRMNILFMRPPLPSLKRYDSRHNFAITLQITFCRRTSLQNTKVRLFLF